MAPPPASESEVDDEESEEDEEEDDDPTPAPNRIRQAVPKNDLSKIRAAARRVAEMDDTREDSIMDSDEEEDADEVDDLL